MRKNKFSDLTGEADYLLNHGYYKKAIELYKQLLKQEFRPAWQETLKLAYLKWAQALVDKKMYQEAITVWESCPLLHDESRSIESYLLWLIQAGYSDKAIQTFLNLTKPLEDSSLQRFSAILGILLLAEKNLVERFPVNSIFRQHATLIQQVLLTYDQGGELEPLLKQISFRSPYRDLRHILKALLCPTSHHLLEKVPTDSPYQPFVQCLQWDISKLLNEFGHLTQFEQRFLVSLKGLNHDQVTFIHTITQQHDIRLLFKAISAHQSLLGSQSSQQFCLALLPFHPHLIHLYEKTFGPLSPFEKKRIQALYYERQGQITAAEKQWQTCVDLLKVSPHEPHQALKIALILRHLVALAQLRGAGEDEETIETLKESLQFDPKDKLTHLHILELLKNKGDKRNYSLWVELAVKQFPHDGEILEMAAQAAWRKKAYKKAMALANKLLKREPFHPQAKQILCASHLAYARKLIKNNKYDLARQELDQAGHLAPSQSAVPILQGLLAWQRGEAQASAWHWFQQSEQLDGGKLIHLFHLSMEAQLLEINGFSPPLEKDYLPSTQEILRWINLIHTYEREGIPILARYVERFHTPVQRAVTQVFSKTEMITICHCFRQIRHYQLLDQYARQALQCWPASPIFVFYQTIAQTQDEVFNLHEPDIEALQQAVEHAQQQGDHRTVMLIMRFLGSLLQDSSAELFEVFFLEDEQTKKTPLRRGKKKS